MKEKLVIEPTLKNFPRALKLLVCGVANNSLENDVDFKLFISYMTDSLVDELAVIITGISVISNRKDCKKTKKELIREFKEKIIEELDKKVADYERMGSLNGFIHDDEGDSELFGFDFKE